MEITRPDLNISTGPKRLLQNLAMDGGPGVGAEPAQQRPRTGLQIGQHDGMPIDGDPELAKAADRNWTRRILRSRSQLGVDKTPAQAGPGRSGGRKLDKLRAATTARSSQGQIGEKPGAFRCQRIGEALGFERHRMRLWITLLGERQRMKRTGPRFGHAGAELVKGACHLVEKRRGAGIADSRLHDAEAAHERG